MRLPIQIFRCYRTSVRSILGKYWSSSFLQVYGPSRRRGPCHKLVKKKNESNISPVTTDRTSYSSLMKVYYYGSISNFQTAQGIVSAKRGRYYKFCHTDVCPTDNFEFYLAKMFPFEHLFKNTRTEISL